MTRGISVGIDLGTTNSVVSVPFGNQVQVIENSDGDRRTPSVVSFDRDGVYVGQAAVNRAAQHPEKTIYSIKRQMGNDDYSLQAPNGREYSPVEISAMILRKLKQDAEEKLDDEITNAVITVPAYFGNEQREATKTAGEIAGFEVDRIINEPTAAAMAYGYREAGEETLLIYDLGGGTFDVSLVQVSEGLVEVQATDGDSLLGGEDWDGRILDRLIDTIEADTGWNPETDAAVMQRLWDAAEEAKHDLSTSRTTSVNLPFLVEFEDGAYNLEEELSREEFERSTRDLLERTLDITDRLLADAGIYYEDVDDVLLVGGSTRMPQVREAVADAFGRDPNTSIDPDMAVAVGAAKQASTIAPKGLPANDEVDEPDAQGLARVDDGASEDILLVDVVSKTLGTEAVIDGRQGRFSELIARNTTIPERVTSKYRTVRDGQERVDVGVYQGESEIAAENEFLGEFQLSGIPPAPAGEMTIEVTFEIDENGILHASARNPESGREDNIVIESGVGISERERDRMRRNLPTIE